MELFSNCYLSYILGLSGRGRILASSKQPVLSEEIVSVEDRKKSMQSTDYKPLLHESDSEDVDLDLDSLENGESGSPQSTQSKALSITERVPPEWALLLLGCAVGLATGGSVVLFNLTVSHTLRRF